MIYDVKVREKKPSHKINQIFTYQVVDGNELTYLLFYEKSGILVVCAQILSSFGYVDEKCVHINICEYFAKSADSANVKSLSLPIIIIYNEATNVYEYL